MSEEDRAAKAARAKALLKKRQQKKAGGPTGSITPGLASPVVRPYSPALSEVPAPTEEKSDILGDVFTKGDDSSWVSSLPPASISPPATPLHDAVPSSQTQIPSYNGTESLKVELQKQQQIIDLLKSEKAELAASLERLRVIEPEIQEKNRSLQLEREKAQTLERELDSEKKVVESMVNDKEKLQASLERFKSLESELQRTIALLQEERNMSQALDQELQNQQQTISLLVSEKTSLTSSLEQLEDLQSRTQEQDILLTEERRKTQDLQSRLQELEGNVHISSERVHDLESRERELSDRCRDQEREIQLAHGNINELREEADRRQRRINELEEQIESDDRVEVLEGSLKNTQDRADELEFQLSKLKQAHTTLRGERDSIESQLRSLSESEAQWESKYASLQQQHTSTQEELASVIVQKDTVDQEKSSLQSKLVITENTLSELRQQLADAVPALVANERQLYATQVDLRAATRRAEEAEKIQQNLQAEGTKLMRSLDEMRPKIVELTDVKLELGERVEGLEIALRKRDATIAEMESLLEKAQDARTESEQKLQGLIASREKERLETQEDSMELQRAYADVQGEIDNMRLSLQALEAERANHHKLASQQMVDIDRLTTSLRNQTEELSTVRQELDNRRLLEDEEQAFVARIQNEVESLRTELSSKDEELQRIKDTPHSPDPAPRSLDDEMLSAIRQQYALEVSSAQSQIRLLETSVFEAEARAHSLQKQVRSLEEELVQSRSTSRAAHRPFSPSIPSRPSSRTLNHSDLRRSSFGSHRPSSGLVPPPTRTIFDQGLSAETRHARKVSLSMLKARIDSELAAAVALSNPGSRAMSPALGISPRYMPHTLASVPEPPSSSVSSSTHSHSLKRPQFLDESHIFWCHACRGDLVIL